MQEVAQVAVADGTKVPPVEKAPKKREMNIWPPDAVKYVERDEFITALAGVLDNSGESLEDSIIGTYGKYRYMSPPKSGSVERTKFDLADLAQKYYELRNKGARLPKFSRWVTGMFAGDKELANLIAAEGQRAAKREIILSTDKIDILRCADTPHFQSCFAFTGTSGGVYDYGRMPKRIAERCPGIGIIYVDDEKGQMMGRQWVHHAEDLDTGEHIAVLTVTRYGCIEGYRVAQLMAQKGIKVAVPVTVYGGAADVPPQYKIARRANVKFHGCFTEAVHHDLITWNKSLEVAVYEVPQK